MTPLPQEVSKCRNAQFLQWILEDDDIYFKKNHSILNLREFIHREKYRFLHNMLPSPYCVTRPQWVKRHCNFVASTGNAWKPFLCAPIEWEATLQCNVVSHWLGAFAKWSLNASNVKDQWCGRCVHIYWRHHEQYICWRHREQHIYIYQDLQSLFQTRVIFGTS